MMSPIKKHSISDALAFNVEFPFHGDLLIVIANENAKLYGYVTMIT